MAHGMRLPHRYAKADLTGRAAVTLHFWILYGFWQCGSLKDDSPVPPGVDTVARPSEQRYQHRGFTVLANLMAHHGKHDSGTLDRNVRKHSPGRQNHEHLRQKQRRTRAIRHNIMMSNQGWWYSGIDRTLETPIPSVSNGRLLSELLRQSCNAFRISTAFFYALWTCKCWSLLDSRDLHPQPSATYTDNGHRNRDKRWEHEDGMYWTTVLDYWSGGRRSLPTRRGIKIQKRVQDCKECQAHWRCDIHRLPKNWKTETVGRRKKGTRHPRKTRAQHLLNTRQARISKREYRWKCKHGGTQDSIFWDRLEELRLIPRLASCCTILLYTGFARIRQGKLWIDRTKSQLGGYWQHTWQLWVHGCDLRPGCNGKDSYLHFWLNWFGGAEVQDQTRTSLQPRQASLLAPYHAATPAGLHGRSGRSDTQGGQHEKEQHGLAQNENCCSDVMVYDLGQKNDRTRTQRWQGLWNIGARGAGHGIGDSGKFWFNWFGGDEVQDQTRRTLQPRQASRLDPYHAATPVGLVWP